MQLRSTSGGSRGGAIEAVVPPKTYESNLIIMILCNSVKQHDMKPFCRPLFCHSSVTKPILYLSCSCEPVMRLTTKFYGNCPSPKVTGWIRPCAVPPDNLRSGLILAHFQLNTVYIEYPFLCWERFTLCLSA